MSNKSDRRVNIIGAGLSGLSAAVTLAKMGAACNLISSQPSERAQSVLAEGGINAALDTMGEHDTTAEHFSDTMKGGCYLESETAVRNLTENAPEIVSWLFRLGTPFQSENGNLILRNFGGQKKKRTAYAKSSTGKMIMTALIDETRKYEAQGLITRYPHHEMTDMEVKNGKLISVTVRDNYTGEFISLSGCTILCTGGLNGFFEGMTTGTSQNTGNAAAIAFSAGAELANLEFIQYHPTTVGISGKRMLVSEAARGEGGRLFIMKSGKPYYFMEEKYPELGNLMPRDVVSREMFFVTHDPDFSGSVMLDMTALSDAVWENKLSDLRAELISYLDCDPKQEPVAVSPGIHFFMGGLHVNDRHETNIDGLFAAGEAACIYHGANRLGGNSMLGAVFGGKTAAEAAAHRIASTHESENVPEPASKKYEYCPTDSGVSERIKQILFDGLGIVREGEILIETANKLREIYEDKSLGDMDKKRAALALAMAESALARKESRGAHYRSDYPETSEKFHSRTVAKMVSGKPVIRFEPLENKEENE